VQSQLVRKQAQGQGQNSLFDRKIDLITAGLQPYLNRCLQDENQVSRANALTIYNYIIAMKTEINLSENYRRTTIVLLIRLSRFLQNKSFNLSSISCSIGLFSDALVTTSHDQSNWLPVTIYLMED
jgi:hypothetical protein